MKQRDQPKYRDPEGRDSPLAMVIVVLINLIVIGLVIAPLVAAHRGC